MKLPKNPLDKLGRSLFAQATPQQHIATFPGCVVLYEFLNAPDPLDQLVDKPAVEEKLGKIIASLGPRAILAPYTEALGIRVISVQRLKDDFDDPESNILGEEV